MAPFVLPSIEQVGDVRVACVSAGASDSLLLSTMESVICERLWCLDASERRRSRVCGVFGAGRAVLVAPLRRL